VNKQSREEGGVHSRCVRWAAGEVVAVSNRRRASRIDEMKFELKPNNRNVDDETILEDLRRVARENPDISMTSEKYSNRGRFHSATIIRRFGSWHDALEKAGLQRTRNYNVSIHECIGDLKDVSRVLGKESFTREEYSEHGKYSSTTVNRLLGSWLKALQRADLQPTRNWGITNEELFENIEGLWRSLGRQPYYSDCVKPVSKYCAGTYEKRFGSWRKALEAFVAYINDESARTTFVEEIKNGSGSSSAKEPTDIKAVKRATRTILWRLRFLVMRKDNFTCKNCGRSPAAELGVILHVDHKKAWSKGGLTTIENLQTLCQKCNIGKSNLPMEENV